MKILTWICHDEPALSMYVFTASAVCLGSLLCSINFDMVPIPQAEIETQTTTEPPLC